MAHRFEGLARAGIFTHCAGDRKLYVGRGALSGLGNPVAPQALGDGRVRCIQPPGQPAAGREIVVQALQQALFKVGDGLLQAGHVAALAGRCGRRFLGQFEIADIDDAAFRHRHGAEYHVLQLPDVADPAPAVVERGRLDGLVEPNGHDVRGPLGLGRGSYSVRYQLTPSASVSFINAPKPARWPSERVLSSHGL